MKDDPWTIVAIGVLAATLADICHETIGHGGGCIIDGGTITLLTSIWFKCRGATALTDAAGGIASLAFGLAALRMLRWRMPPAWRLALLLFGGISLFWFAGQLVSHALRNADDWFFVALQLGWPPIWRPVFVLLGVLAYAGTIWLCSRAGSSQPQAVRLAFAAGAASAVIAGAAWAPARLHSAVEAFTTLFVLPSPLLAVARTGGSTGPPIGRSWSCIGGSLAVYAMFLATQARGLGG